MWRTHIIFIYCFYFINCSISFPKTSIWPRINQTRQGNKKYTYWHSWIPSCDCSQCNSSGSTKALISEEAMFPELCRLLWIDATWRVLAKKTQFRCWGKTTFTQDSEIVMLYWLFEICLAGPSRLLRKVVGSFGICSWKAQILTQIHSPTLQCFRQIDQDPRFL